MKSRKSRSRLRFDPLEDRAVPSTIQESEPNNTQATAQNVTIATGDILTTAPADWLTIEGSVATNSDLDFYAFTLSTASGVFFDIDSLETGLSTTLDAQLHLFNSSASQLATNDDGYDFEGFAVPTTSTGSGVSNDSSLYVDLAAGNYAIRVQSFGNSSNGNYHLRLLADSNYTTSVPVLSSNTGASDTLYLDFDGHSATDAWGTYAATAYDFNSNAGQYSPAERWSINNVWRVISEDYSSFAINITTAAPGTIGDAVGHRQVITNSDGAIVGAGGALGVAFLNSYAGGGASNNVSFTFAATFSTFSSGGPSGRIMATPVEIGNTTSHEFGHALGLNHYRTASNGGSTGDIIANAIMATPDEGLNREIWAVGTNTSGNSQNDMAIISNGTNSFGYRTDDHGGSTGTATVLSPAGNVYSATGRIEQVADVDFFRFTGSGATTITLDVFDYTGNLDTILRLRDSSGNEIAINDPAGSFDSSISQTLSSGTYYVDVRSTGANGRAGQYSLRINTIVNNPPVLSAIEASALAYAENDTLAITNTLTVADVDSANLSGATVAISTNFVAGQDELLFTNQNGITGSFSAGTLTLSGTSSLANYQTALRSVQYRNTSDAPSTLTRRATFQVTDTTSQISNTQARDITVSAVNDAPVLDNTGNMSLSTILEDEIGNNGTLITDLIGSAGGDRITDVDTGAVEGIAVIGADTASGSWEFSTNNGGSWSALGSVSATSARLLAANTQTRIRIVPSLNFNGSIPTALTFRAWDQASGANGGTADPSTNGGITAFSTAIETASIAVTAVNDAPSFAKGADQTNLEDSGSHNVNGWATSILPGPADENSQTVNFQVSTNNDALFSTLPAISAGGNLTYTLAADANGSAIVTVRLRDNGGTANGGIDTSADQTFIINVTPVNDMPSFTKGSDQTVLEDAGPQTVGNWATNISTGPANESSQTVTFLISTSNDALFTALPAINPSGQLTYTTATNANGNATVTVRVRDSGGTTDGGVDTSGPQTFVLNVTAVNDAPGFTKGSDQTVLEDAGAQTVGNWATSIGPGPADESGQTVNFQVSTNNDALFAVLPAITPTGALSYTPATDANGSAIVTVRLQDSGGTANGGVDTSAGQTFTINVTPVNDAPSFTKGSDRVVFEDAGPQTVTGWATNLSPGPANENSQTLSFLIATDNDSLFAVLPSVSPAGTLTYTTAANAVGNATVTVRIQDNGGTANGGIDTSALQTFTITVNPVNDAPSFSKGSDQAVLEDAGAQSVGSWATNISPGPVDENGQTAGFLVSTNNDALFAVLPSVAPNGTLTFTPASNANGSALVTVLLQDNGGIANGGVDTSAAQTFTINVTPVNDAPGFTKGSDRTVLEDAGPQTVAGWATGITPGPANESGQTLAFLVTTNNDALFSVLPSVSPGGTLTFTPAADANGSALVTVRVQDNGGTANGGSDTSAAQTFTIDITPVNDAPSFVKGANQIVDEDAGLQTVPGWATSLNPGAFNETSQSLSFLIITNNDALFALLPALDASGNLTYQTADNANGSATITVRIQDNGGTSNGGLDTSAPQSFSIQVNALNDAPTAVTDTASVKVGGSVTIPVLANDFDVDGNPIQLLGFTFAANGNVTRQGNSFVYKPRLISGGTDTFTYTIRDSLGAVSSGTVNLTIIDTIGPKITALRLYYGPNEYLDARSLSRGVLPWERIHKIAIVFNEDVLVNANALALTGLAGGLAMSFSYDAATRTATWTPVAALDGGRFTLRLTAAGIQDTSGNLLASDWARTFGLLAGDFDGNGVINKKDWTAIKRKFTKPKVALVRMADLDGNGIVNQTDYDLAKANNGKRV